MHKHIRIFHSKVSARAYTINAVLLCCFISHSIELCSLKATLTLEWHFLYLCTAFYSCRPLVSSLFGCQPFLFAFDLSFSRSLVRLYVVFMFFRHSISDVISTADLAESVSSDPEKYFKLPIGNKESPHFCLTTLNSGQCDNNMHKKPKYQRLLVRFAVQCVPVFQRCIVCVVCVWIPMHVKNMSFMLFELAMNWFNSELANSN